MRTFTKRCDAVHIHETTRFVKLWAPECWRSINHFFASPWRIITKTPLLFYYVQKWTAPKIFINPEGSLNKFDFISLLCSDICRNSISPSFPGTVLVLWVLKYVFWCHAKLVSGRRLSRIFPDHKNTIFLRTPMYILTLSPWEKISRVQQDSHQPGNNRKDHDR